VFKRELGVFKLEEIIRSKNSPPITDLCKRLRNTVETHSFFELEEQPGFIEWLDDDAIKLKLYEHFVENDGDARVLCYTNRQVNNFNGLIRRMRNLPAQLTVGETLISNQSTILPGKNGARLGIEEEVTILGVSDSMVTKLGVDCYKVSTDKGELLVAISPDQFDACLKTLARNKNWGSYFELKENVADLRPRDAATVYKAQGSTYRTVFVDLENIGTCTNPGQAARMLYVACSRPMDRIYFYGQLPERFRKSA
jgi:hypothetical protein